jgi:cardiolipin synthase
LEAEVIGVTGGRTSEALTRAGGAPLVAGNRVCLLKDATENYPAWISAIESARRWIHFETYIIHDDPIGRRFADLLSAKARDGVRVRLIYDWIGSLGYISRRFWRRMIQSGVEVRRYNTPSLGNPFGWINRDHRKMIAVDGRVAFVTGLCLGQRWIGSPQRGLDPWRDTGVEVEGPAVADIEAAFADSWAAAGSPLSVNEQPVPDRIRAAGNVGVRIVAGVPNVGGMYRLDQLIATFAQQSIWLADAYFVGTTSYVQVLRAAAKSGVDVRLLLPGVSDIPIMRALSRAGLRPLLEAGVRVFEWNGSMMHAKTAVVDGCWARVGSTNLNLASWLNNRELDVIVEDESFAKLMEQSYLDDLSRSTEIVLRKHHPRPVTGNAKRIRRKRIIAAASATRTAAGVMRLGHAVGAALGSRRELGPAEVVIMLWASGVLLALAAVAAYWPRAVAFPAAVICVWLALSLLVRSFRLRSMAVGSWQSEHTKVSTRTNGKERKKRHGRL